MLATRLQTVQTRTIQSDERLPSTAGSTIVVFVAENLDSERQRKPLESELLLESRA